MERPFPAYEGKDPYIFVSYSHSDSALVYPELVRLRDAGFNIWYDEGISPGATWRDELAEALANCDVFLFFITPDAARSPNCNKEVNFALTRERRFLSVYLEETQLPSGLEFSISDLQAILKFHSDEETYGDKLNAALRSLLPVSLEIIDGHRVIDCIRERDEFQVYTVLQHGLDRLAELVLFNEDSFHGQKLSAEAEVFARIEHGNFASLYTRGQHGDKQYCLLSPSGIWNLNNLVVRSQNRDVHHIGSYYGKWNGIPLDLSLNIVRQIAEVLQVLDDEGLFLRQFMPDQFSITEGGRVILHYPSIDAIAPGRHSQRLYQSPEERAEQSIDIRSNIYSLGLTLYEILTGRLPFEAQASEDEIASQIDHQIGQIVDYILNRSTVSGEVGLSFFESKARLRVEYEQFEDLLTSMLARNTSDRLQSPEDLITFIDRITLSPTKRKGSYLTALYTRQLTHRRTDEEQQEILVKARSLPNFGVEAITGEYRSSTYGTIEFSQPVEGKVQFLHKGMYYSSEVVRVSPERWELLEYSYSYRFEFREDGSVARVWVIHSNGYEVPLQKVRSD